MCAMLGAFILRGFALMALQVAIALWGYLRPSESDSITVENLVPPAVLLFPKRNQCVVGGVLLFPKSEERPGKTGNFDEVIILEGFNTLRTLLYRLRQGRADRERLWHHNPDQSISEWHVVVQQLGIEDLDPCRYAPRHGGGSEDPLC